MRAFENTIPFPFLICILTGLFGCRPTVEIRSYSTPKERYHLAAWTGQSLSFIQPAAWLRDPSVASTKAVFKLPHNRGRAEIVVTCIPISSDSILRQVNRCRTQLGLDEINEGSLANLTRRINVNGIESKRIEMTGEQESTSIVIVNHENMKWVFKILGDSNTVSMQLPSFESLIDSVRFDRTPSP